MEALVWARVPGDIVFSIGVFAFVWFVFRAFVPSKNHKDLSTVKSATSD
jgi:nitric oxide reductase subunit B